MTWAQRSLSMKRESNKISKELRKLLLFYERGAKMLDAKRIDDSEKGRKMKITMMVRKSSTHSDHSIFITRTANLYRYQKLLYILVDKSTVLALKIIFLLDYCITSQIKIPLNF